MEKIQELKQLFQNYIGFANGLPRESAMQILFQDRKTRSSEHPGHDAFYSAVGEWTAEFRNRNPNQEELLEALDIFLFTAVAHKDSQAYWYLVAVQRHSLELLPLLEPSHREILGQRLASAYPRNRRMPVQQEILDVLQGKNRKKRGFFSFGR